jgi:zinc finger protein
VRRAGAPLAPQPPLPGSDAGAAAAARVAAFCTRLDACAAGEEAFTLLLDDPAGNSALEWFGDLDGGGDSALRRTFYTRTPAQNVAIGCMSEEQGAAEEAVRKAAADERSFGAGAPKLGCTIAHTDGAAIMSVLSRYSAPEEVMVFPGDCPGCRGQADTRMFATRIPYFREVVVMCTSCDACGYRNSDLRAGGPIPARGRLITLAVRGAEDLSRDVIKSETADVAIPELELELGAGTLGGRVTTVEGLVSEVRDALQRTRFSSMGDSAVPRERATWDAFYAGLEECITGSRPFTLVLRDPLASCYVAGDTADPADDTQLHSEEFTRTFDEDEELGLHDMDTGEEGMPGAAGGGYVAPDSEPAAAAAAASGAA